MTICRSSRTVLLALAALPLLWRVVPAQDTTQAAPQIQDTTQAAAAFQGQLPTSHTVVRGETLWSIAQMYFSDPLLWPEIYRLNTAVIEDPHWIYPGEVLNLAELMNVAQGGDTVSAVAPDTTIAAADTVRAAPGDTIAAVIPTDTAMIDTLPADTTFVVEAPPPTVNETFETIFDRRRSSRQQVQDVLRAYTEQPYRPVRPGEFYGAGFLTEGENLPWAEVVGTTSTSAITRLQTGNTATIYDEISIRPPKNASYHVGDSVLLARIDRALDFGRWGEVVVPVGIARVTKIEKEQLLARVVGQYGRVHDGRLAMPLEPFRDPGQVRPTPVEQGMQGKLVAARDIHAIAGAQQYYFIDKGRSDGVTLGDVFEAYQPAGEYLGAASEEIRAVLMVVHTREHSSTGLLIQITHPGLQKDLPVRLIKKMPS
jgi:LysM repeat protein